MIFVLLRIVYSQIITLEEGFVCNIIPCGKTRLEDNPYKYGMDEFGDLQQVSDFTFTFQVQEGAFTSESYILSLIDIRQNSVEYKLYLQKQSNQNIFILDDGSNTLKQFTPTSRGWFLIAITKSSIMVSNFQTQYIQPNNFFYKNHHQFNLFQYDSNDYWSGQGCCVSMYIGFNLLDQNNIFNQLILVNYRKPELMVHLNIQELNQPKITADYSLYKFIAKLGDEFAFEDDDPILQPNGGFLFNQSQFIVIENFKLNIYSTFEFRLILSDTFLSDIILMDFYSSAQTVLIFLSESKFILKFDGYNYTFPFHKLPVIHFSLSIVRLNIVINQQFVQFIQYDDGEIIFPQQKVTIISIIRLQSSLGKFYIGSKQNQFQENEYFILLIFRFYQGFFIDQTYSINPLCKLYLADRCISCIPNYVLSIYDDQYCVDGNNNQITQTFSENFNQLVRKCNLNCATCLMSDPSICLSCYGNNRSSPPLCNCPAQYFDDYVHSDCKQFIADRAFETGRLSARCGAIGQKESSLTSQYTYSAIPNILVFLSSVYNPCNNQQVEYGIVGILNQQSYVQLIITSYCSCVGQILQFQYTIDNTLNQKIIFQYSTQNLDSSNPTEIQIRPNPSYNHLLTSIIGWNFVLNLNQVPYFVAQTSSVVGSEIARYELYGYNYTSVNVNAFYSNFLTINSAQQGGQFNIFRTQNMPYIDKSIQFINFLQEIIPIDNQISYTLEVKWRQADSITFRTARRVSSINQTVVFATFQCKDQLSSCDFYDYYNLYCILSSICTCDSIGYYQDQGAYCQKCDANCYQCQQMSNYCLSCYPNSDAYLQNNSCVCQNHQYLFNKNMCKDCPALCLTCDEFQCNSCKQYSFLSNKVCECQQGYYFSSIFHTCLECNSLCFSCSDSSGCSLCKATFYLDKNQCICNKCYYQHKNQCQQCQLKDSLNKISCQYNLCKLEINYYCNDNNIIPNDGCFNNVIQPYYGCQEVDDSNDSICHKCQKQCIACVRQTNLQYCFQCDSGYFNSNYECIKCNDPQCKICNSIYNCQICNNNLDPLMGVCLRCEEGYYRYEQQCIYICGDGIKAIDEECDDGNSQNFDGCRDCQLQQNFICSEYQQLSVCRINLPPQIYIESLSQQNNLYQLIIQSDQDMKFSDIYATYFLNNLKDNSIVVSQEYSNKDVLEQFTYKSYLQLQNKVDQISIKVQFQGNLVNQYNQGLVKNYVQFELTPIMILSDQEIDSTQIISQIANVSTQLTICISVLMIFINGLTSVIGQLNLISIFQYMQFLNIDFPPNLLIFMQSFQSYNFIQYIYNTDILNSIISMPYQQPEEIFYKKGINAYFIYNIQSYIFFVILFYILKYVQKFVPTALKWIYMSLKQDLDEGKFSKVIKVISVFSYKSRIEQKQYGIIKLTQAMAYQISFAILLQLKQTIYYDTLAYILALTMMIVYIKILLLSISNKDWEMQKQGIIAIQLINLFKLTEPFIYIFTLVFNQSFPIQQILLISFHQIITLIFLIYFLPYKQRLINYEVILQQVGLFVNHLSFILFIYNPIQSGNINIGWVQILIFFSIIIVNLILESYMAVSNLTYLYNFINQRKRQ